jgi:hypothetical protein
MHGKKRHCCASLCETCFVKMSLIGHQRKFAFETFVTGLSGRLSAAGQQLQQQRLSSPWDRRRSLERQFLE